MDKTQLQSELSEAYRKFQAADEAGDVEAAKSIKAYATQLEQQLAAPTEQSGGLAKAVQHGDAATAAQTQEYLADSAENPDALSRGYYWLMDKVHGPGTGARIRAEEAAKLRDSAAANRERLKEVGYSPSVNFKDIGGVGDAAQWLGETAAGSLPMIAAGSLGGAGLPVGASMASGQVNEAIRERSPQTPVDERLAISTAAGIPMSVLNSLGVGPAVGVSKSALKGVATAAGVGGATNVAQEGIRLGGEAAGGVKHEEGEALDRIIESGTAGAAGGGLTRGAIEGARGFGKGVAQGTGDLFGYKPYYKDGDIYKRLSTMVVDEANRLADVESSPGVLTREGRAKLKDIGKDGAQLVFNNIADRISSDIAELRRVLSERIDPTKAADINDLFKRMPVAGGTKSRRRLTTTVPEESIRALDELVGYSPEGKTLVDLMRLRNEASHFWRGGFKGGVSRYTDYLSPISKTRLTAGIGTGLALGGFASGGLPLVAAQMGVYGGGRALDALTGQRSRLYQMARGSDGPVNVPSDPNAMSFVALKRLAEEGKVREIDTAQRAAERELAAAERALQKVSAAQMQASIGANRQISRLTTRLEGFDDPRSAFIDAEVQKSRLLPTDPQVREISRLAGELYDRQQAERTRAETARGPRADARAEAREARAQARENRAAAKEAARVEKAQKKLDAIKAMAEQAQNVTEGAKMRASRRRKDDVGGGGADYTYLDYTGLLPSEVDKGLLMLVKDGRIKPGDMQEFLQTPEKLGDRRFERIQDFLKELIDEGKLKRAPGWKPRAERMGLVRGTTDNAANRDATIATQIQSSQAIAEVAMKNAPNPEIATAAMVMAAKKDRKSKSAVYEAVKAKYPEHEPYIESMLGPLRDFGPREANESTRAY